MKAIRLFFVGIVIFSMAFLATTVVPPHTHAIPKAITTGEYPDAEGARCSAVIMQVKLLMGMAPENQLSSWRQIQTVPPW